MASQIIHKLVTNCRNKHQIFNSGIFKLITCLIMILTLIIVLNPWSGFGSVLSKEQTAARRDHVDINNGAIKLKRVSNDAINLELLRLIFRDLSKDGILKMGDNGLVLSNNDEEAIHSSLFLRKSDMEYSSVTDLERQSSIPTESFDFTLTRNFGAASEFIDRTLKVGGFVAVQLGGRTSYSFDKPSNYRIVYFRRLMESNVVVMKKMEHAKLVSGTQIRRRLFGYSSEAKKAALKNLEDVLLEPPRASSGRSRTYLKRTKYLPDLLGDTLESYPRRLFIDVGGSPEKKGCSGTDWFVRNYPTRNLKFEMYKIETLTNESSRKDDHNQLEVPPTVAAADIGMSDWLRKNVKEPDYVVMKAEAEVVEDMIKSKAINFVDELFLECKPEGHGGRKNMGSKRAYWECLALYGKLRDEGVAVHQWWG